MKKRSTATAILAAMTAIAPGRSSVFFLMALLLCLSFGSCKKEQTPEERNLEETSGGNDSRKKVLDSLEDGTTDSKIKAEEIKRKDVILRKTKAQYAIY